MGVSGAPTKTVHQCHTHTNFAVMQLRIHANQVNPFTIPHTKL
jgi:hypothetical protein